MKDGSPSPSPEVTSEDLPKDQPAVTIGQPSRVLTADIITKPEPRQKEMAELMQSDILNPFNIKLK